MQASAHLHDTGRLVHASTNREIGRKNSEQWIAPPLTQRYLVMIHKQNIFTRKIHPSHVTRRLLLNNVSWRAASAARFVIRESERACRLALNITGGCINHLQCVRVALPLSQFLAKALATMMPQDPLHALHAMLGPIRQDQVDVLECVLALHPWQSHKMHW
jgi:hypothetical protein